MNDTFTPGSPASGTTFCSGPPASPPNSVDLIDDGYPVLIGTLCGNLNYFADKNSNPPTETACCLVEVPCMCGSKNLHGWTLDGDPDRVDRWKVPHCRCGLHRYHVRLARQGELGFRDHKYDPTVSTTRSSRRKRV